MNESTSGVMRTQTSILLRSLKLVHFDKILAVYLVVYFVFSLFIWYCDPDIKDLSDALWFTFQTVTTIGYGDLQATSVLGRILTVILAIYSIAVVAIFTGIIAGFYVEVVKAKGNEEVVSFLRTLEKLPDMDHDELIRISERAKELAERRR
ncbi:MAG: two pore domain potassium channel family protein [Candidatus Methanomethylophilaceae archaeon]|nr:two pore domain potassium channel family protein [Candidatus Methanomethylophilaceae archaeon]